MLLKDILQLIFLEFDQGHDMLNFSEISRRCQRVFHEQIKIVHTPESSTHHEMKYMKNRQGQRHGLVRWWHSTGQLGYSANYFHGQTHGLAREWLPNGTVIYTVSYHHGQIN